MNQVGRILIQDTRSLAESKIRRATADGYQLSWQTRFTLITLHK